MKQASPICAPCRRKYCPIVVGEYLRFSRNALPFWKIPRIRPNNCMPPMMLSAVGHIRLPMTPRNIAEYPNELLNMRLRIRFTCHPSDRTAGNRSPCAGDRSNNHEKCRIFLLRIVYQYSASPRSGLPARGRSVTRRRLTRPKAMMHYHRGSRPEQIFLNATPAVGSPPESREDGRSVPCRGLGQHLRERRTRSWASNGNAPVTWEDRGRQPRLAAVLDGSEGHSLLSKIARVRRMSP